MNYLGFSKEHLTNLEYSLERELLRSSSNGSYACTTLTYCNTRKYHGLLVVPQPNIDNENHLLLSSLDETIVQNNKELNLAVHQYPNDVFYPNGHKYLKSYINSPQPIHIYSAGDILLSKDSLLLSDEERLILRYKVLECNQKFTFKIRPLLAFRQIHKLAKANDSINKQYAEIKNGVEVCMYEHYTPLFMQTSCPSKYIHNPDWYYNIEYQKEKDRGYDYLEDLYTPGYFEIELNCGDEIYFSAGLKEIGIADIKNAFLKEAYLRKPISNMDESLQESAQSFIVKQNDKTEVIAGFPWFGRWGRDTFIALPGLTLTRNCPEECKAVIDTMIKDLKGPLFPNIGQGDNAAYNSVDAPLWFFWALQQYAQHTQSQNKIWKEYGAKMKLILEGFKKGTDYNIHITENGLVWAGIQGKALTWMDAIVNITAVTPRIGMPVEINALWYNAVMFSLEVAELANDTDFVNEWKPSIESFPETFKNTFWCKEKGWLADYVSDNYKDFSIRPNMIFAVSLPYSPLSSKLKHLVVEKVKSELLTPRGLRTLSPTHSDYKERYKGSQEERDSAYHQGTVWPWLLGHFAEAYLIVYQRSGVSFIEHLYNGFNDTLTEAGIGSISEVFDGNPPHQPGGTIAQAWSVSELLRMKYLLEYYKQNG